MINFRELAPQERARASEFYQLTSYKRPVAGEDRVFVAEDGGNIVGAVRIERKNGVQVLRGMYLHPNEVRKGIGSDLLSFIEPFLAESDSYCIPLEHLLGFYGQVGFSHISNEVAPKFLSERIQKYIVEGKRVAIMYRCAG